MIDDKGTRSCQVLLMSVHIFEICHIFYKILLFKQSGSQTIMIVNTIMIVTQP